MDSRALDFLKSLSESFGPSGFEREPVSLVKGYVQRFSDDISSDKLGSLHFSARGKGPVIILPGHVDEVGFIVSGINGHGFLTFNTLGGWFDQVLLGQRVRIRGTKGIVRGVIAAKPPHILPPEERAKVVGREKMFIDIGCSNEREAKRGQPGHGGRAPAGRQDSRRKRRNAWLRLLPWKIFVRCSPAWKSSRVTNPRHMSSLRTSCARGARWDTRTSASFFWARQPRKS